VLQDKNNSRRVKYFAAVALGDLGDFRGIEFLLDVLMYTVDDDLRDGASWFLGEIGDKHAMEPLIKIVQENENWKIRLSAVEALTILDDERAVEPLVEVLQKEKNKSVGDVIGIALISLIFDMPPVKLAGILSSLKHKSELIRYSFDNFGPGLYEPIDESLKQALEVETDKDVRKTIEEALKVLKEQEE